MKYVFSHFDPHCRESPAFVCYRGARARDLTCEVSAIPKTVKTVVLHVGTNDIASDGAEAALNNLRYLVSATLRQNEHVDRIFVTLILPRSRNLRTRKDSAPFIRRFNREARWFNERVKQTYRSSDRVFYIDHGFDELRPQRFLAADGLHPSFEGVALIGHHLRIVVSRGASRPPVPWFSQPQGQSKPATGETVESEGSESECRAKPIETFTSCSTIDAKSSCSTMTTASEATGDREEALGPPGNPGGSGDAPSGQPSILSRGRSMAPRWHRDSPAGTTGPASSASCRPKVPCNGPVPSPRYALRSTYANVVRPSAPPSED